MHATYFTAQTVLNVLYRRYCTEAIFTNSSRTKFAKCSQTYSFLLGRVRRWGQQDGCPLPLSCQPHLCLTKVTECRSGCVRFTKIFILGLDYHIFFHSVGPFKRLETLRTIHTVQVYCTRISKIALWA
jgi:hypothetical protein